MTNCSAPGAQQEAPQEGEVLYEEVVLYFDDTRKWRERYVVVRANYCLECHESLEVSATPRLHTSTHTARKQHKSKVSSDCFHLLPPPPLRRLSKEFLRGKSCCPQGALL